MSTEANRASSADFEAEIQARDFKLAIVVNDDQA